MNRNPRSVLPPVCLLLVVSLSDPGCAHRTVVPDHAAGADEGLTGEAPSTYSIVAIDRERGDLGVAVQSKFFGVGSVVPWVEAGVGAIATQSYANTSYGPDGLALLRAGKSAAETLKTIVEADRRRERRQVGIVDARGGVATFTGKECHYWAGGLKGKDYTVQGNILVGRETVEAMARAFEEGAGKELALRLMDALEAGQRAGGDVRGRQSAAIQVMREGAGYGGNDRYIWLHVEDHPRPLRELRRLVEMRLGRDPLSRARRALSRRQFDDARRILSEASGVDDTNPRVDILAARAEFGAGNRDAAHAAIERALEKDPEYDNLLYQAARLHLDFGEKERAIERLGELVKLNPHYRPRLRREVESESGGFSTIRKELEEAGFLADETK